MMSDLWRQENYVQVRYEHEYVYIQSFQAKSVNSNGRV